MKALHRSLAFNCNYLCRHYLYRTISTTPRLNYDEYDDKKWFEPGETPWERTKQVFKTDWKRMVRRYKTAKDSPYQRDNIVERVYRDPMEHELIPYENTFLIIGGGLVGSAIAWWIKQRSRDEDLRVTVVEADSTVKFAKFQRIGTMNFTIF